MICTCTFYSVKPLTDVASKLHIMLAICSLKGVEQFLEVTSALATSGMSLTCNGLFATDYLQWFTCDANFHSIEIMMASYK